MSTYAKFESLIPWLVGRGHELFLIVVIIYVAILASKSRLPMLNRRVYLYPLVVSVMVCIWSIIYISVIAHLELSKYDQQVHTAEVVIRNLPRLLIPLYEGVVVAFGLMAVKWYSTRQAGLEKERSEERSAQGNAGGPD